MSTRRYLQYVYETFVPRCFWGNRLFMHNDHFNDMFYNRQEIIQYIPVYYN
jgi:hypothetical protein